MKSPNARNVKEMVVWIVRIAKTVRNVHLNVETLLLVLLYVTLVKRPIVKTVPNARTVNIARNSV